MIIYVTNVPNIISPNSEQVPFVSWKAISFFQQFQMKVETIVVLEILAFKIWKNLNKKQNFSKLYRHEILNQSYFSIQNITLTDTFPSFFLWQSNLVIEEGNSRATPEHSIIHINHLLMNLLRQCILCNHKAYKRRSNKK